MKESGMHTIRRFAATIALVLGVAFLPACSGDDTPPDDQQDNGAGEFGVPAEGEVCPSVLPQSDDPGDGLGTQEPAGAAPSLAAPEAAVVCLYDPATSAEGADADAPTYTWRLSSSPVEATERDLKALTEQLARLVPAEAGRTCNSKVKTRWLLVTSVGDDLTGVAVDEFGCRFVRLTDDPFATAPGDATEEGTVSGILAGSNDLLNQIKLVWING